MRGHSSGLRHSVFTLPALWSLLRPFVRTPVNLWQGPAQVCCQHVAFAGEAARRSGLEGGRPVRLRM